MSFDARDLRSGMDVFSADNVYLGTVIWIVDHPAPRDARSQAAGQRQDPAVSPTRGSAPFSGESVGPMPTATLGNSGPRQQSAATRFASRLPDDADRSARLPSALIVLRMMTALNWSTLRPRVWRIPVSLVQVVSLERIVLSATESELQG